MNRRMVDVRHAGQCGGRIGSVIDTASGPVLQLTHRMMRRPVRPMALARLSPKSAVLATCPRHGSVYPRVEDLLAAVATYRHTGRRQTITVTG